MARIPPVRGVVAAGCSVLAMALAGCGYVGDPEPPALRIPVPVDDLLAIERGDRLVVHFTVSGQTTEGLLVREYSAVDLRIGAEGVQPYNRDAWLDGARRIEVAPPEQPGRVRAQTPAEPWAGREVLVGVRLANRGGRWSEWSNLAAVHVIEPVLPPSELNAAAGREGVKLTWNGSGRPGERYRIFRRIEGAKEFLLSGETANTEWIDTNCEYGTSYEYRVQTLVPVADDIAESEPAEPVTIRPVDRFPPAPPAGLTAVAGFDSIELAWDSVEVADFAAYEVFRQLEDSAEVTIAEGLTTPAYSDRDVVSGKRYRYSVVAVDAAGNRSEPSPAVEQTAP